MSKELETQIEDSLFKEKVLSFYKKNKILIIIFLALIILTPISLQTYFYLEDKKNEQLISEYLKAEMLLNNDKVSAIKILNKLKNQSNETVKTLSVLKLLNIYINDNQLQKAISEINNQQDSFGEQFYKDLLNIKMVILKFDQITENEILKLLKIKNNKNFNLIKSKLLYDFYIKSGQKDKAKQVLLEK